MSIARQAFEVLLAGLVAGVTTNLAAVVLAPDGAVVIGVVLASMYYFSRYPWGSSRGAEYNERIDQFYDDYLPF